jgi:CBS domain-containing protein
MKVKDVMRSDVLFVRPHWTVFDCAKAFEKNNISGAPVVEHGRVIGIVSISDLVRFMGLKLVDADILAEQPQGLSMLLLNLVQIGKDYIDFKKELERIAKFTVKDVMSKYVVHISPHANLYEAAKMMEDNDVNRLPVIHNGKLIGIIARADLVRALLK